MSAHRAEAVVLRTWPIREADLLVSLFTREGGKLHGVAKAGAKSRRRFGGALEPMTHVIADYAVRPSQELVRLESFEILHSPLAEPADYERAAALAFYAEVLDEMLPDGDAQDATFRLLLHVLEQTRVGRIWMPVTYFALWMVRLMGWMPDLRRCTVCRCAFEAEQPAWWQPHTDGLLCDQHRRTASLVLSYSSRELAAVLLRQPAGSFAAEPWPRARAADLRRLAMQALQRHGEQRFESVRTLLQLGG